MSKGFYKLTDMSKTEHRLQVDIAMQVDPLKWEEVRSDIIFALVRHGITSSGKSTPTDALEYHRRKECAQ